MGHALAQQAAQEVTAQAGGVRLPRGKAEGQDAVGPAPAEALGKGGGQGSLAHTAGTHDGDDARATPTLRPGGVEPGQGVELGAATAQGIGGVDFERQVHFARQAQAGGNGRRALAQGQRAPGIAGHVADGKTGGGWILAHVAQGDAGLAHGLGQGVSGQQAAVQGDGQIVAEGIGKAALHADGGRNAVLDQGTGEGGFPSLGGLAGAEHHEAQHAPVGQVGQVGTVEKVGPAVVVFQKQHGQWAGVGFDDVAVTGEVQDGGAAQQRGVQVRGSGRDTPGGEVHAALVQDAADRAQFVVDAQAVALAGTAFAVHQGVGAEDEKVQRAGRRDRFGGTVYETEERVATGEELASVEGGVFPGDSGGGVVGVEEWRRRRGSGSDWRRARRASPPRARVRAAPVV